MLEQCGIDTSCSSIPPPDCPSIPPPDYPSIPSPDCPPITPPDCSSIPPPDYPSIPPPDCPPITPPDCSSIPPPDCPPIPLPDSSPITPPDCSPIPPPDFSPLPPPDCPSIPPPGFSPLPPPDCPSIPPPGFSPLPPSYCSPLPPPDWSPIPPSDCPLIPSPGFSPLPPSYCSPLPPPDCPSIPPPGFSPLPPPGFSPLPPPDCSPIPPSDCPIIPGPNCSSLPPPNYPPISSPGCPSRLPPNLPRLLPPDYPKLPPPNYHSRPPIDIQIQSSDCPSNLHLYCPTLPTSDNITLPAPDCLSMPPSECQLYDSPSNSFRGCPPSASSTLTNCPLLTHPNGPTITSPNSQSPSPINGPFFQSPNSFPVMASVISQQCPSNISPITPIYQICPPLSCPNTSTTSSNSECPPPYEPSTIFDHKAPPELSPATIPPRSGTPCDYLFTISSSPLPNTTTHQPSSRVFPDQPHRSLASKAKLPPNHPPVEEEVSPCIVCSSSVERQLRMEQDRQLSEWFLDSLSRFEDWIQGAQIMALLPSNAHSLYSEAELALQRCEVLLRDMREKLLELETLNRQYWRLSQVPHQTLLPSNLRSRMQELNECWDLLQKEVEAKHWTLKLKVKEREEFEMDKEEMRLWLTEMDMGLSNVEHIYSGNSTEKMQQLQAFQEHVRSNMERLEGLFQQGDHLMEGSEPQDAKTLELEMTELGCYCQEIFTRLSRYQKRLVSTKLVFEEELVLDRELEEMSDGSSGVFLESGNEDRAELSIGSTLPPPVKTATLDLEWDPLGDVGRSSSNDEQESYYTATSVPGKNVRREGSHTNLGSTAWTSKVVTQGDQESVRAHVVAWDLQIQDETVLVTDSQRKDTSLSLHSQGMYGLKFEEKPRRPSQEVSAAFSDPFQKETKSMSEDVHRVDVGISCQLEPSSSGTHAVDHWLKQNRVSQRRQHGQTERVKCAQNLRRTQKKQPREVSILIERGSEVTDTIPHNSSCGALDKFRVWVRRLASLSLILLVLGGSLYILPTGRPNCTSHKLTWSLMLTYINGPPPT